MKKLLIVMCVLLVGCASPGRIQYQKKMAEIEYAYSNKEITKGEYLILKNNLDEGVKNRQAMILFGSQKY